MGAMPGNRLGHGTIGILGALAIAIASAGVGCTGGGASAVCGPRASSGQLDAGAVAGLVVAPDENHVAFIRDTRTWDSGCPARASRFTVGTLVALGLMADGSSCERVVAQNVPIYSVAFSGDSSGLVFMDGLDDCGVGDLKTAAADGADVRLLRHAVTQQKVVGSTVFFTSKNDPDTLAAPVGPGGVKPVPVADAYDWNWIVAVTNATGTAAAFRTYQDGLYGPDGSLALVQLPSGESRTVSDGINEH